MVILAFLAEGIDLVVEELVKFLAVDLVGPPTECVGLIVVNDDFGFLTQLRQTQFRLEQPVDVPETHQAQLAETPPDYFILPKPHVELHMTGEPS